MLQRQTLHLNDVEIDVSVDFDDMTLPIQIRIEDGVNRTILDMTADQAEKIANQIGFALCELDRYVEESDTAKEAS